MSKGQQKNSAPAPLRLGLPNPDSLEFKTDPDPPFSYKPMKSITVVFLNCQIHYANKKFLQNLLYKAVFRIRIGFNADPDPSIIGQCGSECGSGSRKK